MGLRRLFASSRSSIFADIFFTFILGIVALLPRLNVALNADLGPDEPVYVGAGRVYIHFLRLGDLSNPGWLDNMQHPAVPKLVFGFAEALGSSYFGLDPFIAARLSAVGAGILTVVALFLFGQRVFGVHASFLAALTLALNPWHVYWSGLAMLDPFLVLFLTLTFLMLLHSRWQPLWALAAAVSFGLAFSSKYTAALAVPVLIVLGLQALGMKNLRSWFIAGACPIVACGVVVLANPPVWASPLTRIVASVSWQLHHASVGHPSFYAGQMLTHTPWWIASYVVWTKNSLSELAFVGVFSAAAFTRRRWQPATQTALIWFWGMLATFSTLTIVVADHYLLPLAPPLSICAALGVLAVSNALSAGRSAPRRLIQWTLFAVLLVPLLVGLAQFPNAEGFTNELMRPQNQFLPVATTGYRSALDWIAKRDPTASVELPYFVEGGNWAMAHDHLTLVIAPNEKGVPRFLVLPAFTFQDQLTLSQIPAGYCLDHRVIESGVTYADIYESRITRERTEDRLGVNANGPAPTGFGSTNLPQNDGDCDAAR